MTDEEITARIASLKSQKQTLEAQLLKANTSAYGISQNYNQTAIRDRLRDIDQELAILERGSDGLFMGVNLY